MEKFVGREKELKFLKEKYNSEKSEFIIIYGRRRLGKTKLLQESIKNNKNSLYFLLTKETPEINLIRFKDILSKVLNNSLLNDIIANSWEEYFSKIKDLLPEDFTIIFDEIPYLFSQNKSIISQFQKIYDEYLLNKKINLILCGSSISIMDEISSYSSPLYGRRTGKINLKAFNIIETKSYLSKIKNLEEIFKYQLIFGGIPYYLKQINQDLSFEDNISNLFLSDLSIFDDEVSFLLKEEFREVRNYISILRSISKGYNTLTRIAENSLIERSTLSKYLISLEKLDLISQNISFFDKENSKKTIYKINDNFIFIWFSIFEKQKQYMINDLTKKNIISQLIPQNLGYLFEKECKIILSNRYFKIGSFFNKEGVEVDLVCENEDKSLDVYECKFKKGINEKEEIYKLEKKLSSFPSFVKINKVSLISIDRGITIEDLIKQKF